MILTILGLISWYIIGICSFILWWTRRFDFKTDDVFVCCLVGFQGPFAFLIGFLIHFMSRPLEIKMNKILIKRRG